MKRTRARPRTRLFVKGTALSSHADQVDNLRRPKRFEPKLSHNQRIERAETFFAPLAESPGRRQPHIRIAPDTPEAIYLHRLPDQSPKPKATIAFSAHETGHYTAHPSRCNRELGKRFGDSAYAMEELIAELCSAFVMARLELELTPRADHSYRICLRG